MDNFDYESAIRLRRVARVRNVLFTIILIIAGIAVIANAMKPDADAWKEWLNPIHGKVIFTIEETATEYLQVDATLIRQPDRFQIATIGEKKIWLRAPVYVIDGDERYTTWLRFTVVFQSRAKAMITEVNDSNP